MSKTDRLAPLELGAWSISTFVTPSNWKENCYLAQHLPTGDLVLIDPGGDDGAIADQIVACGGHLRSILLTHAHHDHVGGVAALARQFGVGCRLHPKDVRLLHHSPMYAMRFSQKKIELPGPFSVLAPEETLEAGGEPIRVLHTPGHTGGSVCYAFGGVAFTGDTLLFEVVGRLDLPGAEPQLIQVSVDHLLTTLDPDTLMLPGHGRPWRVGDARAWWAAAPPILPQYKGPAADPVLAEDHSHG